MYVPNNRVSNYAREKLIQLQKERNESTIIAGDINISLLRMNKSNHKGIFELYHLKISN